LNQLKIVPRIQRNMYILISKRFIIDSIIILFKERKNKERMNIHS